jgi:hypothetical protein
MNILISISKFFKGFIGLISLFVSTTIGKILCILYVLLITPGIIEFLKVIREEFKRKNESQKERIKRILKQDWIVVKKMFFHPIKSKPIKSKYKMVFTNYADYLQWSAIEEELERGGGAFEYILCAFHYPIILFFHLIISEIIYIIRQITKKGS